MGSALGGSCGVGWSVVVLGVSGSGMRSRSCCLFIVVVGAAPLKGVSPCVVGEVDVDVSSVISTTHPGSTDVTLCVWHVPVVYEDDKDVSLGEIAQTAGDPDKDGGIFSAWRVWVPVVTLMTYCRSFHRGCGFNRRKNGISKTNGMPDSNTMKAIRA